MHENSSILYETIPINMIGFRLMSFRLISQRLIIALFPVSARSPVNIILLTSYLSKSLETILKLTNKKPIYIIEENNGFISSGLYLQT